MLLCHPVLVFMDSKHSKSPWSINLSLGTVINNIQIRSVVFENSGFYGGEKPENSNTIGIKIRGVVFFVFFKVEIFSIVFFQWNHISWF